MNSLLTVCNRLILSVRSLISLSIAITKGDLGLFLTLSFIDLTVPGVDLIATLSVKTGLSGGLAAGKTTRWPILIFNASLSFFLLKIS